MANTATISKDKINERLDEINDKIRYGYIDEAITMTRELYAEASSDPSVQSVMSNLDQVEQRAKQALNELDKSLEKYNWKEIYNLAKEIKIMGCNDRIKQAIYLRVDSEIQRFNDIVSEALILTLHNKWDEANSMITDVEITDINGVRAKKLRSFFEQFKTVCTDKNVLSYDRQRELKELFNTFDDYYSDRSPVKVLWSISSI